LTPHLIFRSSTYSGETSSGSSFRDLLARVGGHVEGADRLHVPTGAWLTNRREVGGGIIWVPDRDNASVDVGGQRIDGIEDRLRDSAGLIDDHQYIARMDALECSRVVVRRLAAVTTNSLPMYHLASSVMRPGRPAFLWALPM
jgi:hypothetical protein